MSRTQLRRAFFIQTSQYPFISGAEGGQYSWKQRLKLHKSALSKFYNQSKAGEWNTVGSVGAGFPPIKWG